MENTNTTITIKDITNEEFVVCVNTLDECFSFSAKTFKHTNGENLTTKQAFIVMAYLDEIREAIHEKVNLKGEAIDWDNRFLIEGSIQIMHFKGDSDSTSVRFDNRKHIAISKH